MRVLVTNDDGVQAPGLRALARAVRDAGYDVVVAAPDADYSGTSASLGPVHLGNGVAVERLDLEELLDVEVYAVAGPPALCVLLGRLEAFGAAPDLVASGINPGNNTGRAVLHSGTVGAALSAANFGFRGLAVSVGDGPETHWATAAHYVAPGLRWLAACEAPSTLNVNVPNIELAAVAGVASASLAAFGTVRTAIAGRRDGRLELELRATDVELEPGTDTALVSAGWVAVTALVGPRAHPDGLSEDAAAALAG